ncbi:protein STRICTOSIDINE SYNTHASE-LIKE 10-like isoform X2 [Solanum pennellii]|uniref:Protein STRICTOSIDINE SYNTHASE-LIKE 10-like isoform X2 n=1 Tax=Solanum pennellii TaxID=28526 RepID=A0ABM1H6R0_SOLPN|nr:protein STRICTOSIDINE SYNTHASE-LIKE 10-like isoform X2 [Solanum pennellii]
MNDSNILLLFIATVAFFASVNLAFDDWENALKSQNVLSKSEIIQLNGAIGPESVAFDPNGEGPYIGVADGRILKFQGSYWADFAVTSSQRESCTLPFAPEMEHICGRPLGLRFDTKTGELYIADAYFGLQVVGPKGGLATPLVQKFEDTSTRYQRRQFVDSLLSRDATGRLMKYTKSTKKTEILIRGLAFANGVSLSKDRSFVLVAETSNFRILRYWLKGPLEGTHDTFAELPGFPDNIRMNSKGEFWVAIQAIRSQSSFSNSEMRNELLKLRFIAQKFNDLLSVGLLHATAIKLSEDGRVLEVLEDVEGKTLRSISEVHEIDDKLLFGSVIMPFLGVYEL